MIYRIKCIPEKNENIGWNLFIVYEKKRTVYKKKLPLYEKKHCIWKEKAATKAQDDKSPRHSYFYLTLYS